MRINKLKLILLIGILFSCCFLTISYAETLDVKLSREKIALGETLTVSFILNDTTNIPSPDFGPLQQDFNILGSNYGNSINSVNGVQTIQTFYEVTLEPKTSGVLTIPAINFGNIKSAARKITVQENANNNAAFAQDTPTFIQAEINSTNPYIQSQVLYTIKLFYQNQLESPRIEIPKITDATFVQVGEDKNYQTNVNGKSYYVFEKNFALFPQKSGEITIPPSHFRALTYDPSSRRMYDPFDIVRPQPISLATKSYTLNVRKIPEKFKGGTWLPAEDINLNEKWSTDQWEVGVPVTRTITIQTKGLRADQIPDLNLEKIAGVNTYIDPPQRKNSLQDNSVSGTLEQKITYIPSETTNFNIPAIKLNWWNTRANANVVSQLNSIAVHVKGVVKNVTPTALNDKSINKIESQPIKKEEITQAASFYMSVWFWIAISLLIMWVATLWFMWGRKISKKIKAPTKQDNVVATEVNEETFARACKQGDIHVAQQFLLSWAKMQWQDIPISLEKLSEMIDDEGFKLALGNLQQALYSKKSPQWDGKNLFTAYKHVKKHTNSRSRNNPGNRVADPLPPLHP